MYNYLAMVQDIDYIIDVTPKPLSSSDYFFVPAALRGLGTTLRHCLGNMGRGGSNKKNIWVVKYPENKRDDRDVLDGGQERSTFRGVHRLNRDIEGRVKCVACFMCSTACPANCIEIVAGEAPWEDREKFPVSFTIDELKCIFFGAFHQITIEERHWKRLPTHLAKKFCGTNSTSSLVHKSKILIRTQS